MTFEAPPEPFTYTKKKDKNKMSPMNLSKTHVFVTISKEVWVMARIPA